MAGSAGGRSIRPVEIYLHTPPPDPAVARPVRGSQVSFADLAEPQSQNVAGTLFGPRLRDDGGLTVVRG